MSLYYNCRQTLQRTISNICRAGQYIIIEYTQRIHVVQHGNVNSHTGALGLLNAVYQGLRSKFRKLLMKMSAEEFEECWIFGDL